MGEQTTIEGVIDGGDIGGDYVPPMPEPVSDHQPLADVNEDMRAMIEGKRPYNDGGVNGDTIVRQEKDNQLSIRNLTYAGKGPVKRAAMRVGYAFRVLDPINQLEKMRANIETRIEADQRVIESIDYEVTEIDRELDGVDETGYVVDERAMRNLLKNAEAMVLEYEEALGTEQRKIGEETQQAEEIKSRFSEERDPQKKQELAQAYQAFQQNIVLRRRKERDIQQKLGGVSWQYNNFFDNVEQGEQWKAKYTEKRDVLQQDKATLESLSFSLGFFVKRENGAMRIAKQVGDNQRLRQLYEGVVAGLEKVSESESVITRKLPGLIKRDRTKRKRDKDKATSAISQSREEQIKLAKQRISSSGIVGV
jgi:hypothetical protein